MTGENLYNTISVKRDYSGSTADEYAQFLRTIFNNLGESMFAVLLQAYNQNKWISVIDKSIDEITIKDLAFIEPLDAYLYSSLNQLTIEQYYCKKDALNSPKGMTFIMERNWYRQEIQKLKTRLSKSDLTIVEIRESEWRKKMQSSK